MTAGVTLISAVDDMFKANNAANEKEKAAYSASSALKVGGVATGAAIGSIIAPGIGTLIGAGIGGIAGWIAGDSTKKKYEQAMLEQREAEAAALLVREQSKFSSKEMKDATASLLKSEITTEQFNSLFQKKVMLGLKERFGDISLSLEEIQSISRDLTFGDAAEGIARLAAATDASADSLYTLESAAAALERLNWKYDLKIGWEETDDTTG